MRGEARVRKALVVAGVVACGSTGCLQAGGPPSGQHWLSGRTLGLVQFAPDLPGVPLSLLVTDGSPSTETDLYVVAAPGPTVSPSAAPTVARGAKLLLSNVPPSPSFNVVFGYQPRPLPEDAMGRLFVSQATSYTGSYVPELFRVDLTTDSAVDLGPESSFALSPSGSRLAVGDGMTGNATVYEADGEQTTLTNISALTFVGEDLYGLQYDNPDDANLASLQKIPPNGAPQTIAGLVSGFQVVTTTNGPLIVVSVQDGVDFSQSLLDLTTLAETPAPGDFGSASPDGRWLVLFDTSYDDVEVFDRSTGTVQVIDTSYSDGLWRPGHDEYWMSVNVRGSPDVSGDRASPIQIWQPGTGTTTFDVATDPTGYYRASDGSESPFTADGQHWFSYSVGNGNRGQILVGSADDPGGPTFPVNPLGTGTGDYWQLGDGRLLVEASVGSNGSDIYLLDPNSGQERELATGGAVLTIGLTRALALLNVVSAGTGDLTLIDYATGATTLVGQNVTLAVLQHPFDPSNPTVDALASGAKVAFLVRDELDSPYDGVWVATLP